MPNNAERDLTNINEWREEAAFRKFREEIQELYRQQVYADLDALKFTFGPRPIEEFTDAR